MCLQGITCSILIVINITRAYLLTTRKTIFCILDMRKGEVDGCWGWMIVAAAALNRIVIYGISYSAGVVYVVILEVFNEGSGITSWISSLITAVLFFTCKYL